MIVARAGGSFLCGEISMPCGLSAAFLHSQMCVGVCTHTASVPLMLTLAGCPLVSGRLLPDSDMPSTLVTWLEFRFEVWCELITLSP